jgi:long-chain fatty acid transport protein
MNRRCFRAWLIAGLLMLLVPGEAVAGGLFLPLRGVRSLGRAGAFVAGADDALALTINPAGLSEIESRQFLADLSLVFLNDTFQRAPAPPGSGAPPAFAPVHSDIGPAPPPTLALAWRLPKNFVIAGGIFGPYGAIPGWPASGPQRYSLVSIEGSILASLALGVAWTPHPAFSIGAAFINQIVKLKGQVTLSAYPGLVGAPEDPDYDAATQFNLDAYFNPTGILGITIRPAENWRIGLAGQAPTRVSGSGSFKLRLPSGAFFDNAKVQGDRVDIALWLPAVARAGVEWRPSLKGRPEGDLRLEVSFTYESWSLLDRIQVRPVGVSISGIPAIGSYTVGPSDLILGYNDTFAVHLGGEYTLLHIGPGKKMIGRAGYAFEKGAASDQRLSVFARDSDKHILGLGGALQLGKVTLEFAYGVSIYATRTITNSASKQVNPINREPNDVDVVGNGTYSGQVHLIGGGIRVAF